jgi:hypothetical protein
MAKKLQLLKYDPIFWNLGNRMIADSEIAWVRSFMALLASSADLDGVSIGKSSSMILHFPLVVVFSG